MQDLYDYIDQHAGEYMERLQALCRQPSIAAQDVGMAETAGMVLALLREVGADPLELWHSYPFGAAIRDGRMWAAT